jgi:hypothetical protein
MRGEDVTRSKTRSNSKKKETIHEIIKISPDLERFLL